MSWEAFLNLLRCPDCRSLLRKASNCTGTSEALACLTCPAVFPVADGIPILLKSDIRDPQLEIPLLEPLIDSDYPELRTRVHQQVDRLEKCDPIPRSWEWEDVEYWDNLYRKQLEEFLNGSLSKASFSSRERVIQRQIEMKMLAVPGFFPEGIILEVGAGTAPYTEGVLTSHPSLPYVSVDMSLPALQLRRSLLRRPNALYVMASIDNLPLINDIAGLIILIGILHHAERKERTLEQLTPLLRPRGVVYLDEVVERPSFWSHRYVRKGVNVSLHEESIDLQQLDALLLGVGDTIYRAHFHTPFYNFVVRKLSRLALANNLTYSATRLGDKFVQLTLGRFFRTFDGGAISIIWRKL